MRRDEKRVDERGRKKNIHETRYLNFILKPREEEEEYKKFKKYTVQLKYPFNSCYIFLIFIEYVYLG